MIHIIIYLSKPIECTPPRVNPNVNYGLCVNHCRFISCNKCTTLVGDVDNGGGYACVGSTGEYGEISVPSPQFFSKPRCSKKIKF